MQHDPIAIHQATAIYTAVASKGIAVTYIKELLGHFGYKDYRKIPACKPGKAGKYCKPIR